MTDGVMTVDLEGRITTFNVAATQILGIRSDEAASRRFGEVFLEIEGADEFSQAILDAVYESSTSHNRNVPYSNNGKSSILALTTTFLKADDGTGQKIGVIAVFSDITELQKLQKAGVRNAEELKVKHRELQDAYMKTEQGNQQLQAALKKVQVIRITATAFTILLFLGIGLFVWRQKSATFTSSSSSSKPAQAGAIATTTVTPQPISTSISLTGKLQALQMVNINSPLSGKVEQVKVRYGEVVTAGQPLASMDIAEAQMKHRDAMAAYIKAVANYKQVEKWDVGSEVVRANRSLTKAKLSLENQKKTLVESERLFKKGIIPASENESAQLQYTNQKMDYQSAEEEVQAAVEKGNPENRKVARFEMENAETRLKQVEHDIASATVLAPVSGIVMKPPASGQSKEGRLVERGGTFQQGEALFAIGDLSGFSVSCKVDEVDVTKVKLGQKVRVTGDAFPGEQLTGVIQSISPQAEEGEGGQSAPSFGVKVVIETVPPELKKRVMAGMTANLEIMIYEKPDALMVPLSAVKDEQGKRYVTRKKAGSSEAGEKVEVTTGYTTQDAVEILKGLKPGDVIEVAEMSGSGAPSGKGKDGKK
jgi:RND family efflux transporter MFP subunit